MNKTKKRVEKKFNNNDFLLFQGLLKRKRASDIEKMCLIKKKKLYLSPVDLVNTPPTSTSTMTQTQKTGPIIMENTRNIIRHTSSVINSMKSANKAVVTTN